METLSKPQKKMKRPLHEQVNDFLMYRGFETTHHTGEQTNFERINEGGYPVSICWYHLSPAEPGSFVIHTKAPMENGTLEISITIKGEETFMQHFDQLEKGIDGGMSRMPYQAQDNRKVSLFRSKGGAP